MLYLGHSIEKDYCYKIALCAIVSIAMTHKVIRYLTSQKRM